MMKKILASLVITLLLWTASTAIIGSQMHNAIKDRIANINKNYSSKGVEYQIIDYKKNFLTSTLKLETKLTDPLIQAVTKDVFKPLILDYKIEHGPLFFSNGLEFGVAKVEKKILLSTLLKEEVKVNFLELVKDDITINSNMILSFGENLNFDIKTTAIDISEDGGKMSVAPLEFSGISNIATYQGYAKLVIPSLTFIEKESETDLELKNLLLDIKIDELINNTVMLGDINVAMEDIKLNAPTLPNKQLHASMDMQIVTNRENATSLSTFAKGSLDLKDTQLPKETPQVKIINFDIAMKNIGIDGMLKFQQASEEMQEKQSALIAKLQKSKEEDFQKIFEELTRLQNSMMTDILHALNTLLIKDKTTLKYALKFEDKNKKTSFASIDLGYTGDIQFQGSMEKIHKEIQQKMLDLLKADIHFSINNTLLQSLPNAKILQQQLQMGIEQGILKENNGNYIIDASYKNRELMVNDSNMTATVLPLLIMSTQMGGF